jgi:hypothetical protein
MQRKPFLKQVSFILSISFVILLVSLPTGAETNYAIDVVTPSYIEANTVLGGGDEASFQVPLPFPFTFYEVAHTQAYVSTNGHLNFMAGNTGPNNVSLPSTAPPNGAIYALWDDLYVEKNPAIASVRTELVGTAPNRRFVVEWRNVTFYLNRSLRLDFEIVLCEEGTIFLQYRNIDNDGRERGNSATIGVEDQAGTNAVQFSFNSAAVGPGEFAIRIADAVAVRPVPADIKPGGCPNPLNVGSKGVLPFAILGTPDLDVTTIDPMTVTLAGVVPLRWRFEDVGTPYEPFVGKNDPYQCNDLGPDGYLDLVFKFDTQEIAASLGDVENNEVLTLLLDGQLLDEKKIIGEDVVIIKKAKAKGKEKRMWPPLEKKKKNR